MLQQARELAERLVSQYLEVLARVNLGMVSLRAGRADHALTWLAPAIRTAAARSYNDVLGAAVLIAALALIGVGRAAEGVPLLAGFRVRAADFGTSIDAADEAVVSAAEEQSREQLVAAELARLSAAGGALTREELVARALLALEGQDAGR
jgi:hypothetical protein